VVNCVMACNLRFGRQKSPSNKEEEDCVMCGVYVPVNDLGFHCNCSAIVVSFRHLPLLVLFAESSDSIIYSLWHSQNHDCFLLLFFFSCLQLLAKRDSYDFYLER